MTGVAGDAAFAAATRLVEAARSAGLTLGCAESCTGGLIAASVTDVAGSSEVFLGGIVSYAVAVKRAVLGVTDAVLDDPARGVVSGACAEEMAAGARRVLCCDVAVSTTGIAGPGGAEPGKPVGTVWLGVAGPGGVTSELEVFSGDRACVRRQAVVRALELAYEVVRASI